jgi:hypothetical protein
MTLLVAAAAGALLLSACVHDPYRHRHPQPPHGPGYGGYHQGPPPHAPAHGYRAKYRSHHLEFDGRRGVYLVVELPGVYWQAGWYYRLRRDRWQRSGDGDGPWHDARWGDVPIGLRGGKGGPPGQDKGKGRGRDKDKGRGRW